MQRQQQQSLAALEASFVTPAPADRFLKALKGGRLQNHPRLIAELKKASPSKGLLNPDYQPVSTAQLYAASGAQALSVLTEAHYFLGSPQHLQAVHQAVSLPILRKDFVVDPYQIAEARAWGASAVLLLVCLCHGQQLSELLAAAKHYGLDALVEVHTLSELEQALVAKPKIVGMNNRNLNSFEVSLNTVSQMLSQLKDPDLILVAESGYLTVADVKPVCGVVDACLIGEGLIKNPALLAYFNED